MLPILHANTPKNKSLAFISHHFIFHTIKTKKDAWNKVSFTTCFFHLTFFFRLHSSGLSKILFSLHCTLAERWDDDFELRFFCFMNKKYIKHFQPLRFESFSNTHSQLIMFPRISTLRCNSQHNIFSIEKKTAVVMSSELHRSILTGNTRFCIYIFDQDACHRREIAKYLIDV